MWSSLLQVPSSGANASEGDDRLHDARDPSPLRAARDAVAAANQKPESTQPLVLAEPAALSACPTTGSPSIAATVQPPAIARRARWSIAELGCSFRSQNVTAARRAPPRSALSPCGGSRGRCGECIISSCSPAGWRAKAGCPRLSPVRAGLGSPPDHALVTLLSMNGLRIFELNADIDDLDTDRGHRTLRIVRNGGKHVTIPRAPRTSRALDLYLGEHRRRRRHRTQTPHLRAARTRAHLGRRHTVSLSHPPPQHRPRSLRGPSHYPT